VRKIRAYVFYHTLPDNFSDRSAETDTKRLAKPFYCKTILQIVSVLKQTQNGLQSRFTVKRFCKSFLFPI